MTSSGAPCALLERGRIGVFNCSYYKEVLAVRVHPEHIKTRPLPRDVMAAALWNKRLKSTRDTSCT